MTEANISEISINRLWFEIRYSSDIWRALNIAKDCSDVDEQIGILRILVESCKWLEVYLEWKKPHIRKFLDMMSVLCSKFWNDSDYRISLEPIFEGFQEVSKDSEFATLKVWTQSRISQILSEDTPCRYTSAAWRIEGRLVRGNRR